MGSVDQRTLKLLAVKFGGFKKKVCHSAPAPLEPVSLGSTTTEFESFSKFNGQQLCSLLT